MKGISCRIKILEIFVLVVVIQFAGTISSHGGLILTDKTPIGKAKGYVDIHGLHLRKINQAFIKGTAVVYSPQPVYEPNQTPSQVYQSQILNSSAQLGAALGSAISNAIALSKSRVEIFERKGASETSLGFFLYSAAEENWNIHRLALPPGQYDLSLRWKDGGDELSSFHVEVTQDFITRVYVSVEDRIDFLDIQTKVQETKLPAVNIDKHLELVKTLLFNDDDFADRIYGLDFFNKNDLPVDSDTLERITKMSLNENDPVIKKEAASTLSSVLARIDPAQKKETLLKKKAWEKELKQPPPIVDITRISPDSSISRLEFRAVRMDDREIATGFIEFYVPSVDDVGSVFEVEMLVDGAWVKQGRNFGYRNDTPPSFRAFLLELTPGEKRFQFKLFGTTTPVSQLECVVMADRIAFVHLGGKKETVKVKKSKIERIEIFDPTVSASTFPVLVREDNIDQLLPGIQAAEPYVQLVATNYLIQCSRFLRSDHVNGLSNLRQKNKSKLTRKYTTRILKKIAAKHPNIETKSAATLALKEDALLHSAEQSKPSSTIE